MTLSYFDLLLPMDLLDHHLPMPSAEINLKYLLEYIHLLSQEEERLPTLYMALQAAAETAERIINARIGKASKAEIKERCDEGNAAVLLDIMEEFWEDPDQ